MTFSSVRAGWLADRSRSPLPSGTAEGTLSREANQVLADAGLLRLLTESGAGHASPATATVIVREDLAAVSAHVGSLFAVQGLAARPLLLAGALKVRERYRPV